MRGGAGLWAYSSSKYAVRGLTQCGALEGAAHGIRVNSVHPGIIDTPIWGKIPREAAGMGHNAPMNPNDIAKLGAPLGFAGEAQDIANGVLFLASDASRSVPGAELVIDGGITAGSVRRPPPQANQ